ncbi:kinetochore-associated Ndc80 complex subunit nuf2 [Malassezia sp. CBS 17886]|nr:kinetochore-associated Ndc80 complex subunit nuf2 [Malassezia sp. CBS 17886]
MPPRASAGGAPQGADQNYTSFPAVRTEELVAVLHEMGIVVTAEDVSKPQSSMVQKVYVAFLDTLAGTVPEMLERRRAAVCARLEHPEMYEDSAAWLLFFREVQAMMDAATVQDFHMQDLTRPNAKRFKRHMSALVNFFRFRADRLAEFDELVVETEELENRRLELDEGTEQTRAAIGALVAQRQAEEPEVRRLRAENLAYSDRLLQLKKEQGKLLAEVDALKAEKADAVQKQTDVQYQLQIVGAELSKLQARIVTHPDEIRQHLGEMNAQVQGERASLAESARKAQDLQAKMDVLVQLEADIAAAVAAMEQVAVEMDRATAEARAVEDARTTIASHKHEQTVLQHRSEQLERQVKLATERLARAHQDLDQKRTVHQEKIAALTARLGDVTRARKERHALAELRNSEGTDVERQLESLLQEHDTHFSKMQLEKESLCRTAHAYMDAISHSLPAG